MKFKVLLVDDDPVVLFLHQILAKRSGLPSETYSFKNGKEALGFITRDEEGSIAYLVLLDINMPVMNGWEFLDAIQEYPGKEDIYVAIVSSSINSSDFLTARKYPQVVDYLEKPLSKEALKKLQDKTDALVLKDK